MAQSGVGVLYLSWISLCDIVRSSISVVYSIETLIESPNNQVNTFPNCHYSLEDICTLSSQLISKLVAHPTLSCLKSL